MSIRTVSASPTTSDVGLNTKSLMNSTSINSGSDSWVRNSQWLTLPAVGSTEQKVVGLYAIYENANFLALTCAGAYTVNWGDGVTENFASGVTAYHEYSYTNTAFDETLTDAGYKQAIVTVTPQSGQNLTSFNIAVRHNQTGLPTGYSTGWLDLTLSLPNCTSLTIGSGSGTFTIAHGILSQVTILSHAMTNMSSMFSNCTALRSVPLFNTVAVTSMGSMFTNCTALQTVPLFNTVAVNSMLAMFSGCASLQSVPLFNTVAVTNMGSVFTDCKSLQSVPLFNTGAVTNMTSMFSGCASLQSVPLFNTGAVTNMTSMFGSCISLQSVPLFNTGAVTNMTSMFGNCAALQTVPLFNTSAVINMSSMFTNCTSLQSVPSFNAGLVTTVTSMFNNCLSLSSIKLTGMRVTFSVASCKLSAAALNEIFTNLATLSGRTITITSNYGAASCTRTIATNKGWAVTG